MKRTLTKCNALKGDCLFGAPSDDTARKLGKRSETQIPAMRLVKLGLEISREGFGFVLALVCLVKTAARLLAELAVTDPHNPSARRRTCCTTASLPPGICVPINDKSEEQQRLFPFESDGRLCAPVYDLQAGVRKPWYRNITSAADERYWINMQEPEFMQRLHDADWVRACGGRQEGTVGFVRSVLVRPRMW
jgi:hypothetical protein